MVLDIFIQIILPIFILIGVGVLVDRLFKVDLPTLSRLTFYLFLPAIIFVNLVESELAPQNFSAVVGFSAVHFVLLFALSLLLFSIPGLRPQRSLLLMGALFTNAGNYGLPLAQMAFGKSGMTSMALIQVTQSIAIFTLGLWLVDQHHRTWKDMLRGFLSVPLVYAIAGALLINSAQIQIPDVLWSPVRYLSGALGPDRAHDAGGPAIAQPHFGSVPVSNHSCIRGAPAHLAASGGRPGCPVDFYLARRTG
jgi:malate permease and related proteins